MGEKKMSVTYKNWSMGDIGRQRWRDNFTCVTF